LRSLLLFDIVRNEVLIIPDEIICDTHLLQIVAPGFSPVGINGVQRSKL
jgi:hypothetical protein